MPRGPGNSVARVGRSSPHPLAHSPSSWTEPELGRLAPLDDAAHFARALSQVGLAPSSGTIDASGYPEPIRAICFPMIRSSTNTVGSSPIKA